MELLPTYVKSWAHPAYADAQVCPLSSNASDENRASHINVVSSFELKGFWDRGSFKLQNSSDKEIYVRMTKYGESVAKEAVENKIALAVSPTNLGVEGYRQKQTEYQVQSKNALVNEGKVPPLSKQTMPIPEGDKVTLHVTRLCDGESFSRTLCHNAKCFTVKPAHFGSPVKEPASESKDVNALRLVSAAHVNIRDGPRRLPI